VRAFLAQHAGRFLTEVPALSLTGLSSPDCDARFALVSTRRVSVSLPLDVHDEVRASAAREGIALSAWLARAARDRLDADRLIEIGLEAAESLLAEWEAVNGPIPAEARDWADAVLLDAGLTPRPDDGDGRGQPVIG
jgi:hypothetical protein